MIARCMRDVHRDRVFHITATNVRKVDVNLINEQKVVEFANAPQEIVYIKD